MSKMTATIVCSFIKVKVGQLLI